MNINLQRKQNILIVLGIFVLIGMIGGFTYAFFNYTRTGAVNTIRVGNIEFSSTQNGQINLTNAFPVASNTINNTPLDEDNIGVVSVTITGGTTYSDGVEYVISVDNFSNTTLNSKKVPVAIDTTVAGRNSKTLGTSTSTYFNDNVRVNSSVAIYKKTDYTYVFEDEQLLVGYIPQNAEVDGTLTIKAYLDKDKIAISDTYPSGGVDTNNDEEIDYTNGTPSSFGEGRTVLTTQEWNNLQENGISFNIKVEANEGIWVEEVNSINAMNTFPIVITDQKSNIKEVYFNKMTPTTMQTSYNNATIKADLTYNNEGKVLAWLETNTTDNTKYNLIVASDGETYLTTGYGLFALWNNMDKIEFNNVNTSRVVDMSGMFTQTKKLTSINLSTFDTSNVENMSSMFANSNLISIDLSYKGSDNLNNITGIFVNCPLTNIIMVGFNFGEINSFSFSNMSQTTYNQIETIDLHNANMVNVTSLSGSFSGLSSLTSLNLSGTNMSNVRILTSAFSGCSSLVELDLSSLSIFNSSSMSNAFAGCSSLEKIYVSNNWDASNQPSGMPIFGDDTSLVGTAPNGTTYALTDYNTVDKTYAVIATNDTVGYLTDISLKPTT